MITLEKAPLKFEIESPIDGSILKTVEETRLETLNYKIIVAKEAAIYWKERPIKERVQVFFNYIEILKREQTALAELVVKENGKTFSEAIAEIEKSIELTEYACSLPQLIRGDSLEVSKGVLCHTKYESLGIVACITPFNFPNMVPHWTVPNAIVLGNAVILKPSELVPLSSLKIAELLTEAGLPNGILTVINGGKKVVEALCDHPDIEAISFVGSTPVAKIVYQRASKNLKRSIALGGAKNHLIVLPDAHPEMTANNVIASMSGCAGQRCMAASVMVGVGSIDHIVENMVKEVQSIVPGKNLGPVISLAAKNRIEAYITKAEEQGASILVDGRNASVMGKEGGHYVGPTIIDHVTLEMTVASEEIFGPVISIIRVKSLDDALNIENSSKFGNAAAIFTQNGGHANHFVAKADAGMIGVNVGVPVPREPFSFAGWNESKFGYGDITGDASLLFWTDLKKVTTKWNPESKTNWMS